MAELADALDSGAKTSSFSSLLPSIQTSENSGFDFCGRWRSLVSF
jgi:hypothetical protein